MDNALYLPDGTIVSAEELCNWEDEIDEENFVCRSCAIPVEPVAYKEGMKRRPYFRLRRNTRHSGDCGIDGYEKLASIAKYKPISKQDGFPMPYPNKMIIATTREQTPRNFEPSSQKDKSILINGYRTMNDKDRKKHNRTTTTIRPIARHFIDFPNDRKLELIVEPLGNNYHNTYEKVFKKITTTSDMYNLYPDKQIFYGTLYVGNKYKKTYENLDLTNTFIVTLVQGSWTRDRIPRELYQIIVHCSSWSTKAVNTIKREIELAKEEQWEAINKGHRETKSWIFFIGNQDKNNPFLFHVDNHRFICCLVAGNL